jgi:50S ribosomal protein L16 3-hydroxylase
MTYSIGFRAPSALELFEAMIASRESELEDTFYEDANLTVQQSPGEISEDAISRASELLMSLVDDRQNIKHWLGRLVTENRRHGPISPPKRKLKSVEQLAVALKKGATLVRSHEVRMAFCQGENASLQFYADGCEYLLPKNFTPLIKHITNGKALDHGHYQKLCKTSAQSDLLVGIYNSGYVIFSD